MSFGIGGGTQGTVRYALVFDTKQAEQALGTFKNSLTQLPRATQQANQQMGILSQNFKAVSGGLTQQNTLINQSIQQHRTLGQTISGSMSKFSGLATGLSATASSALMLGAGFRDYHDAQIAVDRVTRRLSLGQEALGKAQAKLNDLTRKGVTSGKDFEQAQLDVTQAQKQVEIQTQLVGEAQERMFDSQTQFVVSIVPTVLGAMGTLGATFKDFGGSLGKVKNAMSGLSGVMGGLSGGMGGLTGLIGPLALAIGPLVLGLIAWQDAQKKVSDITAKMAQARDIEDVTKRVSAMNDQFDRMKEPFDSPAFNTIFKMGPGAAIVEKLTPAIKGANEELQKNTTVTGLAKTKLDAYIKAEKEYHEALKTRQVTDDAVAKATMDKAAAELIAVTNVKNTVKETDNLSEAVKIYNGIAKPTIVTQEEFNKKFEETRFVVNELITDFEDMGIETEALEDMFRADPWEHMREQIMATRKEVVTFNEDYSTFMFAWDKQARQHPSIIPDNVFTDEQIRAMGKVSQIGPDVLRSLGAMSDAQMDIIDTTNLVAKNAQDKWPEWKNAQTSAYNAAQEAAKQWASHVQDLSMAPTLAEALDIKVDKNKIAKKWLDYLPDKLQKKIEVGIEARIKTEQFKDVFQEGLSTLLVGAKFDPKDAETFVKQTLKVITEKLPDSPEKDRLQKVFGQALVGGVTEEEVNQLIKELEMDPIPVRIVNAPENKEDMQTGIDEYDLTADVTANVNTVKDLTGWIKSDTNRRGLGMSAFTEARSKLAGGGGKVFGTVAVEAKIIRVAAEMPDPSNPFYSNQPKGDGIQFKEFEKTEPSKGAVARLDITEATKSITRLMGNYAGYIKFVNNNEPMARLNIQGATKLITRLIDNFAGYLVDVSSNEPMARINITGATKKITRLIDNFWGYVKTVNDHEPMIRINNKEALSKISAVKSALKNIPDEDVYVNVHRVNVAQHGYHGTVSGPTMFLAGEAGQERVDISPNRTTPHTIVGGEGEGGGRRGQIIVNLTNIVADREVIRTYRRELGKDMYRFGPT